MHESTLKTRVFLFGRSECQHDSVSILGSRQILLVVFAMRKLFDLFTSLVCIYARLPSKSPEEDER